MLFKSSVHNTYLTTCVNSTNNTIASTNNNSNANISSTVYKCGRCIICQSDTSAIHKEHTIQYLKLQERFSHTSLDMGRLLGVFKERQREIHGQGVRIMARQVLTYLQ